jgi:hypothetical protein
VVRESGASSLTAPYSAEGGTVIKPQRATLH